MTDPLADRTAIVTGAGSGIGAAIASELARAGAHVVVQDLRLDSGQGHGRGDSGCGRLGGWRQRVMSRSRIRSGGLLTRPLRERGRIDILVNNAGLQFVSPIDDYPLDKWNQLIAVLLTGPFLFIQAVLPAMRAQKWGRIINISSINGKRGEPGKAAYCSAKHGVIGLTRTAAMEAASDGITVNAICPALVMTPLILGQVNDLAKVHNMPPDEVIERHFLAKIPTGRATEATEIGSLACYLASDEAASITGQAINVDGGMIMD